MIGDFRWKSLNCILLKGSGYGDFTRQHVSCNNISAVDVYILCIVCSFHKRTVPRGVNTYTLRNFFRL